MTNTNSAALTRCGVVRTCNSYQVRNDIHLLSNHRRSVCNHKYSEDTWAALVAIYEFFDICQGPNAFDSNSFRSAIKELDPTRARQKSLVMSQLLNEVLYIKYGSVIIPGNWFVRSDTALEKVTDYAMINIKKTRDPAVSLSSIDDIILFARASNLPYHVIYVKVKDPKTHSHALMLVLYKTRGKASDDKSYTDKFGNVLVLRAAVIDPHMTGEHNVYDMMLSRVLRHAAKTHKLSVHRTVFVSQDAKEHYQYANAQVPKSSLDLRGYCQTWVALLMEMFARRSRGVGHFISVGILEGLLDLPERLPSKVHVAWRRLALDYLFSRLMDAYAVAIKVNSPVHHDIERLLLKRNVVDVDVNAIMNTMKRHVQVLPANGANNGTIEDRLHAFNN